MDLLKHLHTSRDSPALGMQVSSAFSQLLNLHNLTEEISSAQHERAVRMGEVSFLSACDPEPCSNQKSLTLKVLMAKWCRRVLLPADQVVSAQIEQSTRSTNRSIKQLAENGVPGEKIREALISQSVELIFTAHPTQVSFAPWLICMICTAAIVCIRLELSSSSWWLRQEQLGAVVQGPTFQSCIN